MTATEPHPDTGHHLRRAATMVGSTRPAPPARGQPLPALLSEDRGEIASAVVLTPIFVFTFMLVVQAALMFHARSLVQTAAQDAARATQVEIGTAADGHNAAGRWVEEGGLLQGLEISISRTPTQVNVTITSGVQSLVPFWEPTVAATVQGPVEAFRPQSQRR
ncbi:MAG: pilus assembly protein [Actinomycetia bacterium]|nr:pilus assembly protein [Actinomycetes bacterium]